MAARGRLICSNGLKILLLKLIFLGDICLISCTESTVFAEEEINEKINNYVQPSTTELPASIEDTISAEVTREEQSQTEARSHINNPFDERSKTISTTNIDHSSDLTNTHENPEDLSSTDSGGTEHGAETVSNLTDSESQNTSDANSTNKMSQQFWSCVTYNISEQKVIILKDKNSLVWWLDELNKTMGCAVVLFYAKWCYFSANLAPLYNAVGRAFSGIPILAIDAYTHNSLNTRYGIVGVPTIILFQESRPVARFNRSRTYKDLVEFIHESTGMEYNSSVEVDVMDYEEGPLPSTVSDDFNFHLFGSLFFLLIMAALLLWHLQYVQVFSDYFMSLSLVRTLLRRTERVKND
ncbi:thioredoxin domain-containing protein 15-like [Dendronephthya gigantea]|uniref:thioredoxin domain-containing protein 15-like n=1 Tax=Dendronephthya gigantea TaxID=151771 RepID=UPI0010690323|nr:thioredoxin domain-containing protein 15-like [Dendronephthya gigantea]